MKFISSVNLEDRKERRMILVQLQEPDILRHSSVDVGAMERKHHHIARPDLTRPSQVKESEDTSQRKCI
jgi:hypothetical protein